MTAPRGLTPEEAAVWRRVTATVKPLVPSRHREGDQPPAEAPPPDQRSSNDAPPSVPLRHGLRGPPPRAKLGEDLTRSGLDASWERHLAKAQVAPEATIDLHGLNLAQAHDRVVSGLAQASAAGVRVVLVIAGKPRPHAEHDLRGQRRGAIRARLLDWLAASELRERIAAVRPAHGRHGGAGALYVILRRRR